MIEELYQIVSIAFALASISLLSLPLSVIVAIASYRALEILVFATHWSFCKAPEPEDNPRRALVMFLLNLAEVIFWSAPVAIALSCVTVASWEDSLRAVYTSLRTAVTIGPDGQAKDHIACISLYAAEITLAYLLTVVIVAGLLSAIQRNGGTSKRRESS